MEHFNKQSVEEYRALFMSRDVITGNSLMAGPVKWYSAANDLGLILILITLWYPVNIHQYEVRM